ncbi:MULTISPECIES: stage V sporulation protein AA [Fictibacillus]|uniref:Stage V sporulation protein AA n=1 Tax=Fictibacillus enclensis TaxID=1017270 RepID=A0A0V8JFD4_9BACL|nr:MULTISPECIES: stage V sporulation protein AA [Fictibacillus]KSU85641.1 stage V sporulation protein AA [Fictibacillus enclensis]RXY98665.1 stage V sporulation protein AA [Fictibacillus sp. S7]SCC00185.1 stage V sporulation protein AA [Fictibacillus enclensis]
MKESAVYIRMRQKVQVVLEQPVTLGTVAQIVAPPALQKKLQMLVIYQVKPADKHLIVLDVMKAVQHIQHVCPGIEIQTVGPAQSILEIQYQKKKLAPVYFVLVWLLLFIGSALAIMNFHEDVSMQVVHQKIYYMVTGTYDNQPLILQIPYSLGLGIGMVLFFNHVFKKRLNEEPSPLEVEMFKYQQDLDQYVVIHENKETEKKIHGD